MHDRDLDELYRTYAKSVYKFLLYLSHDSSLSEELTQETFYQAVKGIKQFRGDCKVSVWLNSIAKNLWYKELKKRKREMVPIDDVAQLLMAIDDVEMDYLQKEDKTELFRRLHELDEISKEVVMLRLLGDLSFLEIGNIMNQSETWARVTYYRCKQKLMKGR